MVSYDASDWQLLSERSGIVRKLISHLQDEIGRRSRVGNAGYVPRQKQGVTTMKSRGKNERDHLYSGYATEEKRVILFGVLAVGIACLSNGAKAHDVTLENEGTGGFTCTQSANWDTVRTLSLGSFPHAHGCVITGAADLDNPGGNTANQLYHITVTMDDANPVLDSTGARTVELRDQPSVNDPDFFPVSTTSRGFAAANVGHDFILLCRKDSAGNPNIFIRDSSLIVECIQQ